MHFDFKITINIFGCFVLPQTIQMSMSKGVKELDLVPYATQALSFEGVKGLKGEHKYVRLCSTGDLFANDLLRLCNQNTETPSPMQETLQKFCKNLPHSMAVYKTLRTDKIIYLLPVYKALNMVRYEVKGLSQEIRQDMLDILTEYDNFDTCRVFKRRIDPYFSDEEGLSEEEDGEKPAAKAEARASIPAPVKPPVKRCLDMAKTTRKEDEVEEEVPDSEPDAANDAKARIIPGDGQGAAPSASSTLAQWVETDEIRVYDFPVTCTKDRLLLLEDFVVGIITCKPERVEEVPHFHICIFCSSMSCDCHDSDVMCLKMQHVKRAGFDTKKFWYRFGIYGKDPTKSAIVIKPTDAIELARLLLKSPHSAALLAGIIDSLNEYIQGKEKKPAPAPNAVGPQSPPAAEEVPKVTSGAAPLVQFNVGMKRRIPNTDPEAVTKEIESMAKVIEFWDKTQANKNLTPEMREPIRRRITDILTHMGDAPNTSP